MFLRSKWAAKKNRSQVSDGDSLARAQKVWQLEGRENSYKDGMLGKKNTIFCGGIQTLMHFNLFVKFWVIFSGFGAWFRLGANWHLGKGYKKVSSTLSNAVE